MFYKIQKSLGNVSAVLVDVISTDGYYVDFKDFGKDNASIIVYYNGTTEDIHFNGWTFPCVYNNIRLAKGDDIYGGQHLHVISFDALDPSGAVQAIDRKCLYGVKEALVVEYFFSLLFNISCCERIEQSQNLYRFIIDNWYFKTHKKRKSAVDVLSFIESFSPRLNNLKDTSFAAGLKQKISVAFKDAQEAIASSDCPE